MPLLFLETLSSTAYADVAAVFSITAALTTLLPAMSFVQYLNTFTRAAKCSVKQLHPVAAEISLWQQSRLYFVATLLLKFI